MVSHPEGPVTSANMTQQSVAGASQAGSNSGPGTFLSELQEEAPVNMCGGGRQVFHHCMGLVPDVVGLVAEDGQDSQPKGPCIIRDAILRQAHPSRQVLSTDHGWASQVQKQDIHLTCHLK